MTNVDAYEFWALPVCCNVKDSFIEDFSFVDEHVGSIFSISYKDNIILKFKDFVDSNEFNLKLFDNKISFEGQIPLVLYSNNLDYLLKAEKSVLFNLRIDDGSNNYSSGFENKESETCNALNACYKFSDYNSFPYDFILVKIFFDSESLIIDANVDNISFLKFFISENFGVSKDKIKINSINNYWSSSIFPISFNAILQGIVISKKINKKVNVVYYKRHFGILNNLNLTFSVSNCLLEDNKLSKIILKIVINRPLNFLYKFYFKFINNIFKNLFFDGFLEFFFVENKSDFIFFYDNLLAFETSVYNFIYSNFYNLALAMSCEPIGYLLTQIKGNYSSFFKIFKKLDLKNSLIKKSSVLSFNKNYNIFDTSRRGVGFAYLNSNTYFLGEEQYIVALLYKDGLNIFLPYSIIDNNLSNYLKNSLAKTLGLAYNSIKFLLDESVLDFNNFYTLLFKDPYLIEKAILSIRDNFSSLIGTDLVNEYPVLLKEKIVADYVNDCILGCSVELKFEFYSLSAVFTNVSFFVEQGKFVKLKLNNKRIYTIFGLAVDYVFCSANVNCDIKDCLSLEFIEDGEFVFSFRSFFIVSVSAIRTALIQMFDFNTSSTPLDFEEILSSWSVKIDIN
ncbi:hypothetical protein QIA34_03315 [Borreliella yangtzensis]|uniref:Uncharacterized protein n=1 Tax=Borreliella yangtzensis TaxID=683292 RepID=A0ABR6P8J0_9SPIR|nr:hypothetical protein [Borreliella yangtzensis]MBB6042541.1 hypothetical protein [Borreliella yangtzensis]WKC73510.1 hypothetical protein QIA35_03320 [Borreliella yangtzensis]WKC74426.1 hypothetical protein QIA34_03315 [Borreliella yangtzensis]